MTFGMTLAEHPAMAAYLSMTMATYLSMFYILVDYENKPNMNVAARNVNIKMYQLFSKHEILVVCVTITQRKTSGNLIRTGS